LRFCTFQPLAVILALIPSFSLFVTVRFFILSHKEGLKTTRPKKHTGTHFYERKRMNLYLTKKGAKCGILAASQKIKMFLFLENYSVFSLFLEFH
jgi:hypothetical protein